MSAFTVQTPLQIHPADRPCGSATFFPMQLLSLTLGTNPVSAHEHLLECAGRTGDAGLPVLFEAATKNLGDLRFDTLDFNVLADCESPHDPSLSDVVTEHVNTLCPPVFLADLLRARRERCSMVTWDIAGRTTNKTRAALRESPVVSVSSGDRGESSTFHVAVPRMDARDVVPTALFLATFLRRASIKAVIRVMTLAVLHNEEDYQMLLW